MRKGGKKHVLIVDDEQHFRFGVSVALRKAGYITTEAGNGREALRILRSGGKGFDLVMVNLHMPIMNGMELIEEMSRSKIKIPVLAVSGLMEVPLKDKKVNLLYKPFGPEELVKNVEAVIRRSGRSRLR